MTVHEFANPEQPTPEDDWVLDLFGAEDERRDTVAREQTILGLLMDGHMMTLSQVAAAVPCERELAALHLAVLFSAGQCEVTDDGLWYRKESVTPAVVSPSRTNKEEGAK